MKILGNRTINMNKFIGCLVLSALTTMSAFAQSGTNSPYSQYGIGDMADEGVGFNKGMGGVGYGFRKGNEVNPLNPASYASIDSVTMISMAVCPDRSPILRRVDESSMRRVVALTMSLVPSDSSVMWVLLLV